MRKTGRYICRPLLRNERKNKRVFRYDLEQYFWVIDQYNNKDHTCYHMLFIILFHS
jgi:hypothetical protein